MFKPNRVQKGQNWWEIRQNKTCDVQGQHLFFVIDLWEIFEVFS